MTTNTSPSSVASESRVLETRECAFEKRMDASAVRGDGDGVKVILMLIGAGRTEDWLGME